MRALILAAGLGARMGRYTKMRPKGLLEYQGRPIIEWQIEAFRDLGITDIGIVTGYKAEQFQIAGVHYFHNPQYNHTNMIASLMCAYDFIQNGAIVSYADLVFSPQRAAQLLGCSHSPIAVSVDTEWRPYWRIRHGSDEIDLESLEINDDDRITSLGKELFDSTGLSARYIGLNRFSASALRTAREVYQEKISTNERWNQSRKEAPLGYMTDLIMELIDAGLFARACKGRAGWLEFDTERDYESALLHAHESRFRLPDLDFEAP